jgi:hypothetical protein
MSAAMFDRLLGLCARALPSDAQRQAVLAEVRTYTDWSELPARAEAHGIAPLVHHHIGDLPEVPRDVRRALFGTRLRHRRANTIRIRLLGEIVEAFARRNLPLLLLKGSALAPLVYPEPGLRAMRDIDLLVRERDLAESGAILARLGYAAKDEEEWPISRFHPHHQPPRIREVDDLQVWVEVHRRLGVARRDARATLEELVSESIEVPLEGDAVGRTLGPTDMLAHVHYHGFCTPLRWRDELRLVSAADVLSLVEKWLDRIDWRAMRRRGPHVFESLAWFDALSPWNDSVRRSLGLTPLRRVDGIGEAYRGWPHPPPPENLGTRGRLRSLRATLLPPEWWLRVRHGGRRGALGRAQGLARHAVELVAPPTEHARFGPERGSF